MDEIGPRSIKTLLMLSQEVCIAQIYKDKDLKLLGNKIVKKFVSEIDPVVFDNMMLKIVKDIVNTLFEIYKNAFIEKN